MDSPIYRLESVVKAKAEGTDELEDFVGPLDLILHLLSKNKMEIKDIQISSLLSQYLGWMERRKSLDIEVASEFITMASHLIYIKTKMLLSLDADEALWEMEQLIASLEAHQSHENYIKIKSVLPALEKRYKIGRDYLVKTPETHSEDRAYRYSHERRDLRRAMQSVLERLDHRLPPPMSSFSGIVGREPYPVTEKAAEILERLFRRGVSRLRSLFQSSRSRSEVVATFVAILELCKARQIKLSGNGDNCTVTHIGEERELPADLLSYGG